MKYMIKIVNQDITHFTYTLQEMKEWYLDNYDGCSYLIYELKDIDLERVIII